MDTATDLAGWGWQAFFQQQLTVDEWESVLPARIVELHRSAMKVVSPPRQITLAITPGMPKMVVGDWILVTPEQGFVRLLQRKTCFARKAAGTRVSAQLIAANVDTAFIVCSLNEDFNLNRIERYLSLVNEAGAEPVVVLSKADLADPAETGLEQVRTANPLLMVESIDCRDAASVRRLDPWVEAGKTVAVLGSSGAGKSTLINTLAGEQLLATGSIREDDDKGRHTTSRRSIIGLANGALMIDTPGMREIQLGQAREGIGTTFAEIEALAGRCRFADCGHETEPGCAVQAAIQGGELDQRRLASYLKLRREEARNSASLAERRADDRALGRFYKRTQDKASQRKGR